MRQNGGVKSTFKDLNLMQSKSEWSPHVGMERLTLENPPDVLLIQSKREIFLF